MSAPPPRSLLCTISNPRPHLPTENEHLIELPELCPASKNPAPGSTLSISYAAGEHFLELFSLDSYVAAFIGHPVVRDIEFFAQTVAEDCAAVLGQRVSVTVRVKLNKLRQSQRVSVTAS